MTYNLRNIKADMNCNKIPIVLICKSCNKKMDPSYLDVKYSKNKQWELTCNLCGYVHNNDIFHKMLNKKKENV
jgi:hypothetical protein